MSSDVVEVIQTPITVVEVITLGAQGPQGLPGDSIAFEYTPPAPAATWTITHNFGRRPTIAVYIAGEYVLVHTDANSTTATITFPSPMTGTAVLT